jgi:hypothetical protein
MPVVSGAAVLLIGVEFEVTAADVPAANVVVVVAVTIVVVVVVVVGNLLLRSAICCCRASYRLLRVPRVAAARANVIIPNKPTIPTAINIRIFIDRSVAINSCYIRKELKIFLTIYSRQNCFYNEYRYNAYYFLYIKKSVPI